MYTSGVCIQLIVCHVSHAAFRQCYCSVMMDDDSCVMKFIEIVPLTSSVEGSELPDLKQTVQVKVCIFNLLLLF